jgi:hypothetical protein
MSMLEDFWLPRREGGRGTEITTLPGGSNLGEIDDITYFQRKLYRSLNVPISRLEAEQGFSLGRSTEITRDELKFTKFVQRIRKKFTPVFTDILKTQLLLKGVIAAEDWPKIQEHISYDFLEDGHFAALKEAELLEDRLNSLNSIEPFVGTFYSKEYVMKKVLRLTDSEIQNMRDQIKKEIKTDPMDGGIVIAPGGDGIQRIPVGPDGMPVDPKMPADDRAKAALGLDPAMPSVTPTVKQPPPEGGAAASAADTPIPSGEREEEEDKSFIVRNGLKKGKKK